MKNRKTLDEAETIQEKMEALAAMQRGIQKSRLEAWAFRLAFSINAFCLLMAVTWLDTEGGESELWEKCFGVFKKIDNWIMSARGWELESFGEWAVFYFAGIAIAAVLIPTVAVLIAKAVLGGLAKIDNNVFSVTLPECCKETYEQGRRYNVFFWNGFSSWPINLVVCIAWFLLFNWGVIILYREGITQDVSIIGTIFGTAVIAGLFFPVLQALAFIPKKIAAWGRMDHIDLKRIEDIWAEADPGKKAELERRREEQRRKSEEEARKKEAERLAEARKKEAERLAEGRKATIHFSARSRHSVNNFTVYIDDDKKCSFDGGGSRSLKVDPGHHTIRVLVYNDSSEEAYWLNDLSADCEPYKEYDIDI